VRKGIAVSEHRETKDRFIYSRTIMCEDVVGMCHLMGLDPCSPDSRQLRPLLQIFATGTAWAALRTS